MNKEESFMITPSEVNIDNLYDFIIHNLTFNDVLSLYIKLRNKISGGSNNNE